MRIFMLRSCAIAKLQFLGNSSSNIIAVVRQQFVMRINCSIFPQGNSFGVNQRLALTQRSFRIAPVSHCAVQRV